MDIRDKFQTTRKELGTAMIEREDEITLTLTALVAQEHVLLVGPPGTGKSMLSNAIVQWMDGKPFSILLTKFTSPEEVFGPVSIAGLKADQYRRIVTDKMPEADIVFVDEIFKASSAILNTMLTILNERRFHNDGTAFDCPLKLCVGASNEWPGSQEGGKELGALFDRFLLRKAVRPISTDKGLSRLLWDADLSIGLSTRITPAEIDTASQEASELPWGDDAKEAVSEILRVAKREGIVPGDRRIRKSVGVAQALAWLDGADEVEPDHLEILAHALWEDPEEQPKALAGIVGRIANPSGLVVNGLLMEAEQIIAGADLKDLAQAAGVTKKLSEIHKKLKPLSGGKADMARDYLTAKIREVKLATVEAM